MTSRSMAPESARKPHLAKATSEVGDLRRDVDRAFGRGEFYTEKITVTAPELKALAAAPKELAAEPGDPHYLDFLGATMRLNPGSEALAENGGGSNLQIKYDSGAGDPVTADIEMTGFIEQTGNATLKVLPVNNTLITANDDVNKKLVLHNVGAGEITGNASDDATVDVYLHYKVLRDLPTT